MIVNWLNSLKQIFIFIGKHPLAKKNKLKSWYRFISWQLTQLIYPHEVIVPFVGKTKLAVKKGLSGLTGNIYTGLHEFYDMGFLLHFLREDDLFYDIGANAGSYTILASGHVGSKTIAFEPVPTTFAWLQKNIKVNNLTNKVFAKNIGLGSRKAFMQFTASYDTVNHIVSSSENFNEKDLIEVEIDTFDEYASLYGIPILVKMDVEGFETEVLNGMKDSIQSHQLKAIIIELNGAGLRYGFDELKIHEELLGLNFFPYHYDPFLRILVKKDNFGSHNTIYIRDLIFAENRLKTAEKISVFSEIF